MASKRPATIAEYIKAAPKVSQPHLRKIYALLKRAAPKAQETIKWGNPFFVQPKFLFAFSAHKAHVSFAPMTWSMKKFTKELAGHDTTKNFLRIPYDEPVPAALITKIAKYCVSQAAGRSDDKFW